jgi:hypothetical protein
VSKINLIPEDFSEIDKLQIARWRMADSVKELKAFWDKRLVKNNIDLGDVKAGSFIFDDEGRAEFSVYQEAGELLTRTVYTIDPNENSFEKKYIKIGNDWIAFRQQGQEMDGSVKMTPTQAARKIDQYRYKICTVNKCE